MGIKTTRLSVSIGRLKLKNPVMVASGTFGYGQEYKELIDPQRLGAVVTKSLTLEPFKGNLAPRIWETTAGMLNAIGLQNDGVDDFIKNKLLPLKDSGVTVIASIAGKSSQEYKELAKRLDKSAVDAIEINISCPNVKHQAAQHKNQSTRLFAQDAKLTANIVRIVKRYTSKPVITKLSPNVTDITEIAKAAERAGSDAISLINTVFGMAVDIVSKRPRLGNTTGGLSGPAIKPIALYMVWQAYKSVKIPIIGIGGIMNAEDAIEFFLCGATAIQVGTANFVDPDTSTGIIEHIKIYLKNNNLQNVKDLIGKLKR